MSQHTRNLERLLHPKSIAVAGGSVAAEVIRQCRKIGFQGQIWPINPRREEIEGLPCYADVAALPGVPDAAFLAVPRAETLPLVAGLAARGAGGAVCYASGFAEVGGDGVALQQELLAAAGDLALLGPNCYGLLNYLDGCALWPDHQGGQRVERGVAIITQSGNLALNLSLQQHHLPIAYIMALGNKAVTDFHHCIEALLEDPRVTAIGLHIEGLGDVAAFSRAAHKALQRGVPIIALKAGSSSIGAQLTASHTSSLAGADALYDALFQRFGVARVEDLAGFLETLKLLHVCGPLHSRRVGALACSGGDASLLADLGQSCGVDYPALDAVTRERLGAVLGPLVPLHNPLDYQTYIWGNVPALTDCFAAMAQADTDLNLLVMDFPDSQQESIEGWDESVSGFIQAHRLQPKPAVFVSSMAELMNRPAAQRLLAAGIAPMQGMRETLRAIAAAAAIGQRRAQLAAVDPLPAPTALRQGEAGMLDEYSAKRQLAACGLAIPAGHLVVTLEAALQAAELIGYPVVLKAVSSELAHKTELGAVKLNLRDAQQLAGAFSELAANFAQFLVEKMAAGVVAELLVGVTRDPQFGLALTLGAGGILVELLADARTLLLPASRGEIEQALRELRCFALLDGYRGKAKADIPALVDAIEAIARYAQRNAERLLELDVNPLLALEQGAVAVDALVRLVQD
ncbi:acetate--CoA ligase family protein [Pseudomonas sp. 2FG]|uniref:acetate--CoA ligase family protein n=1 Tax=Pseudomonas sp. 2FG TaxID=2502191 RepID=UPI0010F62AFA|nr:acetate--CoA ligase family protein [Pseudomonas sp. 2FG]